MRSEHDAVSLLVDTLDLKINESSLVALTGMLAEVLDIGDVVATCRTYEYLNFLQDDVPWLAGRIDPLSLPILTGQEIVTWADEYLMNFADAREADCAAFLDSLRRGMARSRSLLHVCSLPVRLALTCQTFGDSGHVPEKLTVNELFDQYWKRRVCRHGGLAGTGPARAKADVALKLASLVVGPEDGKVILHIPAGRLGPGDRQGLDLLLSEGVIRDRGTELEFFHQTFAEYGHARWLLSQGVDAPEIDLLSRSLAMGQTGLWDIACSLLLQVRDYEDYRKLAGRFPPARVQGARARAFAALRRTEPNALAEFMAEIDERAELLPAVLGVLADAPFERLPEAYERAIEALRAHPSSVAKAATNTLASLLPRHDNAKVSAALKAALDTLIEARAQVETSMWETLTERMIRALDGLPVQHRALPVLTKIYGDLGRRGQQATLRAHLALRSELIGEEIAELAECALGNACPKLDDKETIILVRWFWNEPTVREARSWASLLTMLNDPLPTGWQNGQVKYVVGLAQRDQAVRQEIFDALVVPPTTLTENTDPRISSVIAAAAEGLAHGATAEQRRRLIAQLMTARSINPRATFPAQIILATDEISAHQEILKGLEQSRPTRGILDSVIDTWLFRASPQIRRALVTELRHLLAAGDSETLQRRARLEAAFALEDAEARK